MVQEKLPVITCAGSPREMGRQYGEQAADLIRNNLEKFYVTDDPDKIHLMKQSLLRYAPEILEELEGIAEGAKVSFQRLLAYNHWELAGDEEDRCTVMALRSSDAGLLVAKNNDSPPDEDGRFLIRKGSSLHGIPFYQVTYAGSLSGLDMINAEGLCNTHGSVGSCFERKGLRLDIRLQLYRLMQTCHSVEELTQGLQQYPLTGKGFSIAVGDRHGNCRFLDAAVPFIAERPVTDNFTFSTNLYEYPGLENADMRIPEKRNICVFRNGYLKWVKNTNPPETLGDLKKLFASHEPWAPCRHGGCHNSVTDWSVIFQPQNADILIAHGSPCQKDYERLCW